MVRMLFASLILLGLVAMTFANPTRLRLGMVIDQPMTFAPGTYDLPSQQPAIMIQGENLDLDFRGVEIRGSSLDTPPNERAGEGIRVRGKNITIRNLRIRGYKVGLHAEGVPGLRLINCDFSDNWKQRLASNEKREDLSDWMSFHQNEKNEWLRFGAGAYLVDCPGFEVRGLKVHRGQCGLMITRSDGGLAWNCDLSYNSALGMGLYRSSKNRIMHNRMDFNVRGYSHGVYNRGQDSAALLMYEQCNENIVAYNSMTHSGDGLFLWAGQTTMDTGQGGCNDNLFFGNDFSHAPTNGIEATFSRNKFLNNLVMECWHGVWGGYSFDSEISGNVFAYNAEAIAIEHGQENRIQNNLFFGDRLGLVIWQNASEDPNWGYPKNRDTRSRDVTVEENTFVRMTLGEARVRSTRRWNWQRNTVLHVGDLPANHPPVAFFGSLNTAGMPTDESQRWIAPSDVAREPHRMTAGGNAVLPDPEGEESATRRYQVDWDPIRKPGSVRIPGMKTVWRVPNSVLRQGPRPLPGGMNPFFRPDQPRGRHLILMDEWGPYDFQSPKLIRVPDARKDPAVLKKLNLSSDVTQLRLLGGVREVQWDTHANGKDRMLVIGKGQADLFISWVPGTQEREVNVQVLGESGVDHWGRPIKKDQPVRLSWSEFFLIQNWNCRFYSWTSLTDPRQLASDAWTEFLQNQPVHTLQVPELDFAGRIRSVPVNQFVTVAESEIELAPGEYIFELTTDDGARLYLDGKSMIPDAWKYQGPTLYTVRATLGGKHKLRVEHFQIDGYMTLQLKIRRG
ncbi:MAG TPA: right-handed parallel beta-helix repeat-containing protein [Fimbriimonadaceae bacterium]|nr:right-handed parallel beta-helix repeat-containing protein [Fimbriimonadaceae bacterium]HRJ33252.1 right-handed parallel beta-helix repeat-containing protein [Fimbriimonadaceae bacterium]